MKYSFEINLLASLHVHILAAVCQAGFTGQNCEEQCEFPNYGYGCQQQSLCPKMRCSTVNGCKQINPGEFFF